MSFELIFWASLKKRKIDNRCSDVPSISNGHDDVDKDAKFLNRIQKKAEQLVFI